MCISETLRAFINTFLVEDSIKTLVLESVQEGPFALSISQKGDSLYINITEDYSKIQFTSNSKTVCYEESTK